MRKPAFAYFYGLCILILFSLLTLLCGGYQISIAYCLFSFKLFSLAKPWLLERETTLQHDMAREICFQGWNF